MTNLSLTKYYKGNGKVVCQKVCKGEWGGVVFVWRCKRNNYANNIPTALNIPFDDIEEAKSYVKNCAYNGVQSSLRKGKRTTAKYEVKILFPMGYTINQAIKSLSDSYYSSC